MSRVLLTNVVHCRRGEEQKGRVTSFYSRVTRPGSKRGSARLRVVLGEPPQTPPPPLAAPPSTPPLAQPPPAGPRGAPPSPCRRRRRRRRDTPGGGRARSGAPGGAGRAGPPSPRAPYGPRESVVPLAEGVGVPVAAPAALAAPGAADATPRARPGAPALADTTRHGRAPAPHVPRPSPARAAPVRGGARRVGGREGERPRAPSVLTPDESDADVRGREGGATPARDEARDTADAAGGPRAHAPLSPARARPACAAGRRDARPRAAPPAHGGPPGPARRRGNAAREAAAQAVGALPPAQARDGRVPVDARPPPVAGLSPAPLRLVLERLGAVPSAPVRTPARPGPRRGMGPAPSGAVGARRPRPPRRRPPPGAPAAAPPRRHVVPLRATVERPVVPVVPPVAPPLLVLVGKRNVGAARVSRVDPVRGPVIGVVPDTAGLRLPASTFIHAQTRRSRGAPPSLLPRGTGTHGNPSLKCPSSDTPAILEKVAFGVFVERGFDSLRSPSLNFTTYVSSLRIVLPEFSHEGCDTDLWNTLYVITHVAGGGGRGGGGSKTKSFIPHPGLLNIKITVYFLFGTNSFLSEVTFPNNVSPLSMTKQNPSFLTTVYSWRLEF